MVARQRMLIVHIALHLGVVSQDCLGVSILANPRGQGRSLMLTMPDDEQAAIMGVMKGVGGTSVPTAIPILWASVRDPYSVGECTRPMQKSRCLQCGAEIGGLSHVPAQGNVQVDTGVALSMSSARGWVRSAARGEQSPVRDMSRRTMHVVRFIMRALLLVATSTPHHINTLTRQHINTPHTSPPHHLTTS
eukprot:CAMPEP_0175910766 /NCGR_PEP_ID=MMETSP0108-20121206/7844_1 /TAXON_ID=195067 ORGANISM="Goniomonas pacifica, Strain CCMP1869" /NCGR_SAMPLE_ID=MMETSP0108 /ASSEMBLY_ACC=CAM_ASM_000204 /LENGTH=190 /DNA_ID=CAMNT_0017232985 /DNA_START=10 /DNA_END=580 /DNA_ORIENTATION=+